MDCKFGFINLCFAARGALNITRSSPRNSIRSITIAIPSESVIPSKIPHIALIIPFSFFLVPLFRVTHRPKDLRQLSSALVVYLHCIAYLRHCEQLLDITRGHAYAAMRRGAANRTRLIGAV